MSVLAAVVLAAAAARVESVSLVAVEQQLAVRVALSGQPGLVTVHRERGAARVSVGGAALGNRFTGGQRFAWTPDGIDTSLLATSSRIDRLEVVGTPTEVSILLEVPAEVSIDVRRGRRGLLLVLREARPEPAPALVVVREPETPSSAPEPPPPITVAAAPARPVPEPAFPEPAAAPAAPGPEPVAESPAAFAETAPATTGLAAPAEPSPATDASTAADTLELARRLFPGTAASGSTESGLGNQASVGDLYGRLFPQGEPQTAPETVAVAAVEPVGPEQGVMAGPFHVRLGIDARYVDADTFVEVTGEPVRDRYLEVAPRLTADAPVGDGRLNVGYLPVFRGFATYDEVNSSSHRLSADFVTPLGPSVSLQAKDSFVSGLLDTRVVDPGGEYFFGLGRFHRNTLEGGLSILTGPRTSVELAGDLSAVRFKEESTFFDYDTRRASLGVGYELSPTLKMVVGYVYDEVPTPSERPEAEARAHSGEVRLLGDILPLLSGTLSAGYRNQKSPNAGLDGKSYSGFVMDGSLTRRFSPDSSFTLYLNRSTPVSAFEENGFYVSTGIQGAARVPLFMQLQLQGGLGYQWNDYRVLTEEIGAPREDRILALYVGLRRPIRRQLFVSGSYRREERHSNVDRFDTTTDGFFIQLEWDIFGSPPR